MFVIGERPVLWAKIYNSVYIQPTGRHDLISMKLKLMMLKGVVHITIKSSLIHTFFFVWNLFFTDKHRTFCLHSIFIFVWITNRDYCELWTCIKNRRTRAYLAMYITHSFCSYLRQTHFTPNNQTVNMNVNNIATSFWMNIHIHSCTFYVWLVRQCYF